MPKFRPRETNRDKLIEKIGQSHGTFNTAPPYERAKAELWTLCVEDLVQSIDNNSKTSHALAKKVLCLNVILTAATAIGTIVAGVNLYLRLH